MPLSIDHLDEPGLDLREVIQRVSDGLCYKTVGGAGFVTWDAANHANVIARTLTETVIVAGLQSRYTPAAFPALAEDTYRVIVWDNGGGVALSSAMMGWTGAAFVGTQPVNETVEHTDIQVTD